jgi:SAM-dependent methyltransferase
MTNAVAEMNPYIPPLRDNSFLIDQIAAVSGVDRQQVTRRFIAEHLNLGTNVVEALRSAGIRPYEWSQDLERFYGSTDAFLYETLVWNRTNQKNDLRSWIGRYLAGVSPSPQRVLAFGDGLGIDSYYLAQLGHEVTYFDVSQPCARFATAIFSSGNVSVRVVSDPSVLEPGHFQAIVCLDTLEHVPSPTELVGWLAGLLRSGGRLIVHAPFYFIHPCAPTHLRTNCTYSGDVRRVFGPHGLVPVGGRLFWDPLVLQKTEPGGSHPQAPPWRIRLGGALLRLGRWPTNPITPFARLVSRRRELPGMVADLV